MQSEIPTDRIGRLSEALAAAGIDAFFGHDPITLKYLTGFGEHGHERFLTVGISVEGRVTAVLPALAEVQARRSGLQDVRGWSDAQDPGDLFLDLAKQWDLKSSIIAVDPDMPAHILLKMQELLPAALFKNGREIIASLMRHKAPSELDQLKKAAAIADATFEAVKPKIKAGLTEKQVERMINEELTNRGGEPAFCIVAAGQNGAEPHHLSDHRALQTGDIVILDFGCTVQGYHSDITRVVAVGSKNKEQDHVYEVVYAAFQSGCYAIRPGMPCCDVDAAARETIDAANFGPYFVHRTGHGIGLHGHEAPNISAVNEDLLQVGDCFSIEPGIYLPGKFGVRIENIVTCVAGGYESLNVAPHPFLEVVGN